MQWLCVFWFGVMHCWCTSTGDYFIVLSHGWGWRRDIERGCCLTPEQRMGRWGDGACWFGVESVMIHPDDVLV